MHRKSLLLSYILLVSLIFVSVLATHLWADVSTTPYSRAIHQADNLILMVNQEDTLARMAADVVVAAQDKDYQIFRFYSERYRSSVLSLLFSEMSLIELENWERLFTAHMEIFAFLNEHSGHYPGDMYLLIEDVSKVRLLILNEISMHDSCLAERISAKSLRNLASTVPEKQRMIISEAHRTASRDVHDLSDSIYITYDELRRDKGISITAN